MISYPSSRRYRTGESSRTDAAGVKLVLYPFVSIYIDVAKIDSGHSENARNMDLL